MGKCDECFQAEMRSLFYDCIRLQSLWSTKTKLSLNWDHENYINK